MTIILAKDLMTKRKDFMLCKESDTLEFASKLMDDNFISCVLIPIKPVVSTEKEAFGVLSKTDIITAVGKGVDLTREKVKSYMTYGLLTCNENTSRSDLSDFLRKNLLHHCIIVSDSNEIVGLVSTFDLVTDIAKHSENCPFLDGLHTLNPEKHKEFERKARFEIEKIRRELEEKEQPQIQ